MAKKKPTMPLMEMELVKSLAHPLRQAILYALAKPASEAAIKAAEEDGRPGPDSEGLLPLSPNLISADTGEPLGNVSYHVKTLLNYECVELVSTRPRRGAVEHFYLPSAKAKMQLMALASIAPELGVENGDDEKEGEGHAE